MRGTEMANYNDNYAYEEEYSRGKKKKKSTATLVISGVLTAFLLAAVVFGIMAEQHSTFPRCDNRLFTRKDGTVNETGFYTEWAEYGG